MATTINASTSAGLVSTADLTGTLQLQSNGVTQQTIDSTGSYGQLKSATAQASTSGSNIDFTGIPSWVKRITVMFSGVSTNGTNAWLIQVGAGSVTTSGYLGSGPNITSTGANNTNYTAGFGLSFATASAVAHGSIVLTLVTGNTWVANGQLGRSDSAVTNCTAGSIALSGTLDRVRITTVGGTDTFDAGSINVMWEG